MQAPSVKPFLKIILGYQLPVAIYSRLGKTTDCARNDCFHAADHYLLRHVKTLICFFWLTVAALGNAVELNVGVYQPASVAAAVLPELLKPWALSAGIRVTPLRDADLRNGKLKQLDVLAVADAESHTAALAFDAAGKKAILDFIRAGGGYVGICAGCTAALNTSSGLGLLPIGLSSTSSLKHGSIPVKIQMTRSTMTVLHDDRKMVPATFDGGPVLDVKKQSKQAQLDVVGLFWESTSANNGKKNPLAFSPAILTSEVGKGRVVGFCIHPERAPGLEGWLPSALRWAAHKN